MPPSYRILSESDPLRIVRTAGSHIRNLHAIFLVLIAAFRLHDDDDDDDRLLSPRSTRTRRVRSISFRCVFFLAFGFDLFQGALSTHRPTDRPTDRGFFCCRCCLFVLRASFDALLGAVCRQRAATAFVRLFRHELRAGCAGVVDAPAFGVAEQRAVLGRSPQLAQPRWIPSDPVAVLERVGSDVPIRVVDARTVVVVVIVVVVIVAEGRFTFPIVADGRLDPVHPLADPSVDVGVGPAVPSTPRDDPDLPVLDPSVALRNGNDDGTSGIPGADPGPFLLVLEAVRADHVVVDSVPVPPSAEGLIQDRDLRVQQVVRLVAIVDSSRETHPDRFGHGVADREPVVLVQIEVHVGRVDVNGLFEPAEGEIGSRQNASPLDEVPVVGVLLRDVIWVHLQFRAFDLDGAVGLAPELRRADVRPFLVLLRVRVVAVSRREDDVRRDQRPTAAVPVPFHEGRHVN
mmetsp:Transcript_21412/g.50986  ORF Transcript_21412/g.50986 Transcript_21412/m.50986 type:complete len:459 (+) Transcript_21412:73-1449(+)